MMKKSEKILAKITRGKIFSIKLLTSVNISRKVTPVRKNSDCHITSLSFDLSLLLP